jgi:hypothetical protein
MNSIGHDPSGGTVDPRVTNLRIAVVYGAFAAACVVLALLSFAVLLSIALPDKYASWLFFLVPLAFLAGAAFFANAAHTSWKAYLADCRGTILPRTKQDDSRKPR